MRAAGEPGQLDVAVDHQLLGHRRPAGQAELAAAAALVHHRPVGQPGDLAVLGQHHVEAERVLHRPAHQQRVLHAVAVVGEDAHAGVDQLGERRQRLARPAHRDAAGRAAPRTGRPPRPARARTRPRHASPAPDRCWASPRRRCSRRGPRPGCRSRSSRPPRGPARAGGRGGRRSPGATTQPVGVEHLVAVERPRRRRRCGRRRSTSTSARRSPSRRPPAHRRSAASQRPPADSRARPRTPSRPARWRSIGCVAPSAPSSSNSTAMRTATPLATCWVITAPGSSAGSTRISTPRFIGPGCITRAWSGSRRARSGVRPKRALYSRRLGTSASVMRSRCIRNRYSTSTFSITSSRSSVAGAGATRRQQRRRRHERDVGAEGGEHLDVAAGHPAVADVADDRRRAGRRARRSGRAPRARCRRRAGPASGGRASRRRR